MKRSKWELILVVFALLILGGAGFVYFTGFPIGKYILGLTEGESAKQVAVLSRAAGAVRRQKEGDADFQGVAGGAALYDADTIVTSPNSTDRIQFPDGSYIVMAPSTMVRLTFGANLTLGGVVRTTSVEVVSGSVSGESKSDNFSVKNNGQAIALQPPKPAPRPAPAPIALASPTPSPSLEPSPVPSAVSQKLVLIYPRSKSHLAVPNGSQVAEVPITFEWRMVPPARTVAFSLVERGGAKTKAKIIFKKNVLMGSSLGQLPLSIKTPGSYRWAIGSTTDRGKVYGFADFIVDPYYQAIQLNQPLIGGLHTKNSELEGKVVKSYDINFSWQPYSDLTGYELHFYIRPDAVKSVWATSVAGTSYDMNQGKVFTGRAYYRVLGRTPNGFVVMSPVQQFGFDFVAPVPATPKTGAEFSKKNLLKEDNTILLTWQKTNFTGVYRIQISTDPSFASPIVSARAVENFYTLKDPKVGTYYWRVQSFADNGKTSAPSAPATLTVTP